MPALATALDSALAGARPFVFGAVEIALPGYTLRLLDGSGQLTLFGNTFLGADATFGTLAAVSPISDGSGDSSPAISLTILPASSAAAATLAGATMQGSMVKIWAGALDAATGLAVSDPYLLFIGELDVATLRAGADGRSVDYEIVSVMERLFEEEEGMKLSDAFHQSIWPSETGLFDVTGVEFTVYWGQQPPAGAVTSGGTSAGNSARVSFGGGRVDFQ